MSALETMMPPPRRAAVNGVELCYYEAGPRRGAPIVLCHGFPELAFSWRHQLAAFGAAGRWVIALDQRGYGQSSKPERVEDYDMDHLTGDLVGLLDHLQVQQAVFCGHDWGGFVTWQMPFLHPDRVAGLIGLNTPFLPRPPSDPIALLKAHFGPDTYMAWFQTPDDPEAVFSADPDKTMRFFFRRTIRSASGSNPPPRPSRSGSQFDFKQQLQGWNGTWPAEPLLTDGELRVFVRAFQQGGFFGPVSWYRNLRRNWERSAALPQRISGVPCLMITAELDRILTPAMAAPMAGLVDDLETHMIPDSGHWTQQEKPAEVNRLILDWLDRRFPQ